MSENTIITRPFAECDDPPGLTFMFSVDAGLVEFTAYYRPRPVDVTRQIYGRKLVGPGPLPPFTGPIDLPAIPASLEIVSSRERFDLAELGLAVGDLAQIVLVHFIGSVPVAKAEDVFLRLDVALLRGDA